MSVAIIKKGLSTILWGTTDELAAPTGLIIESLSFSPKNGAPIDIEDGQGFSATLVFMQDGGAFEASFVYDTSKTYPAEGDWVTLNAVPKTGAAGGVISVDCLVASYSPSKARKKEAMMKMSLVYRPGIVKPA